jgi:hypothetical protein
VGEKIGDRICKRVPNTFLLTRELDAKCRMIIADERLCAGGAGVPWLDHIPGCADHHPVHKPRLQGKRDEMFCQCSPRFWRISLIIVLNFRAVQCMRHKAYGQHAMLWIRIGSDPDPAFWNRIRIRIKEAKAMRIRILVRLLNHKK